MRIFNYLRITILKKCLINIFILALLIGCVEEDNKVPAADINLEDEIMPDQVTYDTEVAFVDSSFTKAILNAGRARVYNEAKETLLDSSVKVTFYDKKDPNKTSVLTCDSARIDDRTKNMIAKGNVVVVSENRNMKLITSILEWKNEQQRLYSTEYVEVHNEREILKGYGFESDPDLNDYKIFKVSGIQNLKGN